MSLPILRLATLQRAVFLLNSRQGLFVAASFLAPFLPKIQGNFAEFLMEISLTRLRILISDTCVGLRYEHRTNSFRSFSWKHDSVQSFFSVEKKSHNTPGTRHTDFPVHPPQRLDIDIHHYAEPAFSSVTPKLKHSFGGTGILTGCASTTPYGLALALA